ncbi:MAG TPA: hypothetical protein VH678_18710 [Xanthobacteraceae bacterium]
MTSMQAIGAFHYSQDIATVASGHWVQVDRFTYTFENFFHPFVGDMISALNRKSLDGLLDPAFQAQTQPFFTTDYALPSSAAVRVNYFDKAFDVATGGPYASYNWEIFFHLPVMIAVHLSNNQRFAEAQKWFHYVFDPTSTDQSVPAPQRYWKFLAFRQEGAIASIDALLELLSTPDSQLDPSQLKYKRAVQAGYAAMLTTPFSPHTIARTRISAYQYYVVMKYLDNLIAWGDSLFLQDTIETINEATLCYVLAANILGPRPQALPERGTRSPQNFAQLKLAQLDPMSNAAIELEGQFPFNLAPPASNGGNSSDLTGALFGIGQSLYFCIPPNPTLLHYWDIVGQRLFRIRNSENIQGVVQQLPLFDPPIDPGMLVKAAAAGLDVGSIVSGVNQPPGPVRSLVLMEKALELANEVRSLGSTLLSAIEKSDAERLTLLRQGHEIALQQMTQDVRFLQWKQAQEATNVLLSSRATTLERYSYYLALLGLSPDTATVPPTFTADRRELTEDNFDDAYDALVNVYNQTITIQDYSKLQLAGGSSPGNQSGASGQGPLYLIEREDAELNKLLPHSRDLQTIASLASLLASSLTPIPGFFIHEHFWGIGASQSITSGERLAAVAKLGGEVAQIEAVRDQEQAGIASRTAGYQRRANDWILQANLAAHELMQIGRQIIASLIAEQVAYHEYTAVKAQVQQAQDVQQFLQSKFTNADFCDWMQAQASSLYYQYYRFAFDTARKAEQTMKQELMRPELDATTFVQFNYWDSGHRGLLSGEALHLDIKRMEMAYHESNRRELELTRHVSLRQLDPLALLTLKITGSCTVTLPEWLYDRDCPGHYMRRVRAMSMSVPAVAGPFSGLFCALALQRSSVRVSPLLKNNKYARDATASDERFIDYFGSVDSIVTSSGSDDSGLFETNLRDERFLPFEGAGAISTWTLSLPDRLRAFDYMTISDVVLHIRYTARSAGDPLKSHATQELLAMLSTAAQSGQALMFCLRFDFPSQWYAFATGMGSFAVELSRDLLPYMVQSAKQITLDTLSLYAGSGGNVVSVTPTVDLASLSSALSAPAGTATLSLPADDAVMTRDPNQQVFLVMQYHFKL